MEEEKAQQYKEQGNTKYKQGDYRGAIELYDLAIDAAPTNPAYYGNRAAANFMLGKYKDVVQDCNRAVVMDPLFMKGYLRKSKAQLAMVWCCFFSFFVGVELLRVICLLLDKPSKLL